MNPTRNLHVVHLVIRNQRDGDVQFLLHPHGKWLMEGKRPYLTLPAKKTVKDPLAPFIRGTSIEQFVESILREELGCQEEDYAFEQELGPAHVELASPRTGEPTAYAIYPVDVWVRPAQREALRARADGQWLTWEQALSCVRVSPTAKAVFRLIEDEVKEAEKGPQEKVKPRQWQHLLSGVPDRPSVDALAMKWFSRNEAGVRLLAADTLSRILDVGDRAFNLRVADPYLRYQMQGVGFTWSFFTHKDKQDVHMHGAQVVEIYGVLDGMMEIWWKPYCGRGTSAWNHQIVNEGDWLELD